MAQHPRGRDGSDSGFFEDTSTGAAPGSAKPQARPASGAPARPPQPPARQGAPARSSSRPEAPAAGRPAAPPRTSATGIPAAPPRTSATGVPAIDLGGSRNTKEFHRHLHKSTFNERAAFEAVPRLDGPKADDDDEPTQIGLSFDGRTPAPEVTARDLFKAINAPVQSREGRRSASVYQTVIDQFAVGANPRYEPDAPDKPRGHIFVWDVTRAMNAEVPHFLGTRELSAGQTCLWLRDQGSGRGWFQVDLARALEAANAGQPVVVLPKDPKNNQLALMRPGGLTPDNKPYLSAAAKRRGNGLTPQEAFGVFAVQYFFHL